MGSDWSWQLHFATPLTAARAEELLTVLAAWGWRLGPRLSISRKELLEGLAVGRWDVPLWSAEETDLLLSTTPDSVCLTLDAAHTWREPRPEADGYRLLHRGLTELWVHLAERFEAVFGRVEDELSWDRVSGLLTESQPDGVPAPGQWPDWLGWWTYFNAERADMLPNPPAGLRLTPRGAVLALLDDPAAVDPAEFARIHQGMLAS
ncbi:hypothetical protein M8C13_14935 [Crossiella sp. SN42]|uniref:hypothetical protein n=1 Tax=Crossiella sp. SN42 TaxID=2944808 RepID=UPI00207CEA70|nr:hypothetical protein [Crossiella sp. SN42]MCO1577052.1 hypothetical protein [Crossiella sp. SN42]